MDHSFKLDRAKRTRPDTHTAVRDADTHTAVGDPNARSADSNRYTGPANTDTGADSNPSIDSAR